MKPRPLRSRIRNATLLLLAIAIAMGALAIPKVYRLSGAISDTLYRNYLSIEAAQHMHGALYAIQLAIRDGTLPSALPHNALEFGRWIEIEEGDITEEGEAELAHEIHDRWRALHARLLADPKTASPRDFDVLHQRLDRLIEINQAAMFRADSRASRLGTRLTYELVLGLGLLLVIGAAISWTLAYTIAKPLDELADRLRSFSVRGSQVTLGDQNISELALVATEFNRMAQRLREFDRLNVDRLVYEKAKTEAIIESLEDGIVLIGTDGTVTHINETAAIVLGIEREEALGSPFDDLDSNHPHYLRVRSALESKSANTGNLRIEVDLHVRGRDHSYILKQIVLRQNGNALGTLLILQDITYLRDKDRARANLIATLSHELRTPLTSLGLSAQMLQRRDDNLGAKERELIDTIAEDVRRMRQMADNLLNLARGEPAAIAVRNEPVDVKGVIDSIARGFAIQAAQKEITLETRVVDADLRVLGDPFKLSWIISNLIGNALRYTPNRGSIVVSAARHDDEIVLKVTDTGVGIAPEVREHIFERFSQWNPNGAEAGSAGLGLAIVKDIVDAHGGRVFVDSSKSGTEFTVELPAARDANGETADSRR
jgi:NtrC-family two-component system sensor histidine kinase KinB